MMSLRNRSTSRPLPTFLVLNPHTLSRRLKLRRQELAEAGLIEEERVERGAPRRVT